MSNKTDNQKLEEIQKFYAVNNMYRDAVKIFKEQKYICPCYYSQDISVVNIDDYTLRFSNKGEFFTIGCYNCDTYDSNYDCSCLDTPEIIIKCSLYRHYGSKNINFNEFQKTNQTKIIEKF